MRVLATAVSGSLIFAGLAVLTPTTASAGAEPAIAWDFNGNDMADAAIGAPGDDVGNVDNAGTVTVLRGSEDGLETAGAVAFSQDTSGIPGSNEAGNRFGAALASGDIDRDGFADLVIGAPGEDVGNNNSNAGRITILYGSGGGLVALDAEIRSRPNPDDGDRFGYAVAVGDFNFDGFSDTAVGAPGAERVFVYPGSADGIADDATVYSQDSPNVPSGRHSGEGFGRALAAGDVDGDGRQELAIGAPFDKNAGQNDPNGSVVVLRGSPLTESGLTTTGAQLWHRNSEGIDGKSHAANGRADQFGAAIGLADLNGDGLGDLVVGAPGTPVKVNGNTRQDAGAINVIRGQEDGLREDGDAYLTQKSTGIPGKPRTDAHWGASASTGDVSEDARSEVAVGAPGRNVMTVLTGVGGPVGSGEDQLWSQASDGVAGKKEVGDEFGASLRFAKVAGEITTDLLVGIPGEDNGRGAFLVLSGTGTHLSSGGSISRTFSQDTNGIPLAASAGNAFGTL